MCHHLLELWPVCRYLPHTISTERENLSETNQMWVLSIESPEFCYAYWQSNSCFNFPSMQSRRHSRWINTAFQTPSSTSCKRSTTSMSNMLKPNADSLSENAFWKSQMMTTITFQKKILTILGTRESWSRSLFIAAPLTRWLFSYMAVHTAWTQARQSTSSTHARDTCCARSWLILILGTWTMGPI